MPLTKFQQKVYAIVKKIPRGRVISYGEIAKKLKTSPRAVGQALNKNPKPIIIPCHRVICKNNKIGGYKLGMRKKIQLLKKEGLNIKNKKVVK